MNKKADQVNDDNEDAVAVLDDEQSAAPAEDENNPSDAGGAEGSDDEASAAADDEVVVTIGEEAPPTEEEEQHAKAPEWVRELRKTSREDKRRIRELEEKLKSTAATEHNPVFKLGKKPTLEEHDYDTEKFEASLAQWYEDKRKSDEQATAAEAAAKKQQEAWQAKLDSYGKAKTSLKVKDFEDAEIVTQDVLSVTQQGIILQGSENPALVVYALGKNPKKAKELASETDPVKFAFAVAKLETQLKVTNRKAPPPPEKTVHGSGGTSGAVDSTLDRLRADAEKTGDYSKVLQYKRQKKQSK